MSLVSNSTITPSESASQIGKTNDVVPDNQPAQRGRNRTRGSRGRGRGKKDNNATPRAPKSSVSSATLYEPKPPRSNASFATFTNMPIPEPGKHPIVFETGLPEPANEEIFQMKPDVISDITDAIGEGFMRSAKWTEFAANSNIDKREFSDLLRVQFLCFLIKQLLDSHRHLHLPFKKFATIHQVNTFTVRSLAAAARQFGEFTVPAVGSRYVLADFETTIESIIDYAYEIYDPDSEMDPPEAQFKLWVPRKLDDKRSLYIIASCLSSYIHVNTGVLLDVNKILPGLFSGRAAPPAEYTAAISLLPAGSPNMTFFYTDNWTNHNNTLASVKAHVLSWRDIGLLPVPKEVGSLGWDDDLIMRFKEMTEYITQFEKTFEAYFSCVNTNIPTDEVGGSQAQLSAIEEQNNILTVKTFYALTPQQYSLLAAYPCSAISSLDYDDDVVMPTTQSVNQKRLAFEQADWK